MWDGELFSWRRSSLLSTSTSEERFWTQIGSGWINYTLAVVTLVFVFQFARFQIIPKFLLLFRNCCLRSAVPVPPQLKQSNNPAISSSPLSEQRRISDIITDLDLKDLMDNLDGNVDENEKWENVVDRRNESLSYSVKCCKQKDGAPLKYLSMTVFNVCSSEMLRDFYMDNLYRKEWDKTMTDHEQLQLDESNGTEFGRTIKKFPLLTPREYILAWRVWEARDKTYYCYSKECDHPLAPRQKKYVRVGFFRSGWRIREVPGTNSCEIKMVHQEDAGLNVDMAKLIFAKGIWSYVCKMDTALRKYSAIKRLRLTSAVSAITFIQKVPLQLDSVSKIPDADADADAEVSTSTFSCQTAQMCSKRTLSMRPSKKLIANGLILVGGIICLSRGHTNLNAKVAMAFVLSKLAKRRQIKEPSLL